MSRTKIHIDKLFRDGLKNFSLLVSNKDFEAIDDKSAIYKEQENTNPESAFGGFEMDIEESDWLSTKAKLDNEKSILAQDNFMSQGFEGFEIAPNPDDWTKTYIKLKAAKKRRYAYWWLSAGVVVLALGLFLVSQQFTGDKTSKAIATENVKPVTSQPTIKEPTADETQAKTENAVPAEGDENTGDPAVNTTTTTPSGNAGNTASTSTKKSNQQGSAQKGNTKVQEAKPNAVIAKTNSKEKAEDHSVDKQDVKADKLVNNAVESTKPVEKTANLSKDMSGDKQDIKPEEKTNEQVDIAPKDEKADVVSTEIKKDEVEQVIPNDSNKNKNNNDKLPPVKMPKTRIYIAAVNQLGLTHRHLDKNNSARYNETRNAAEKPFAQWTFGIEFGMQKKKGQLSAGIQTTTQTWVSNFKYSNMYYMDSLKVYDPDSNLIKTLYFNPKDSNINEQTIVKTNKIQLPFEFTQFWNISPRLKFMTTLGGIMALTTKQEGNKMLSPYNNYLNSYEQMKIHERKVSFAPSLSLAVQYQLNRSFMVQGGVYGNYSLTSRFKNDFPAKDFPYTIGGSLKLLYLLK